MKTFPVITTLLSCFLISINVSAETYKLSHNTSNTTTWQKGADKFNELVSKNTNGKVKIRVFPNAILTGGDQMKQAEMVSRGSVDFLITSAINVTPLIPEMAVFTLPYLFTSYDEVDHAVQGEGGKTIANIVKNKGITVLAWGENGFREITNNKKSINSPDDLKGMKIRVAAPMYIDVLSALGANPQQIQWTETFSALQQGVVDGQENPIGSIIIPQRLYEIQKYITLWHYSYDPIFIGVSNKLWNTFDADTKKSIRKAAQDAMQYQIKVSRDLTKSGIETLKSKGMTVTELTPEQIQAFKAKTKPVFDKWKHKIGDKLVDEFENK